ncbi:MAG: hypothetical protein ACYDC8_10390 [Gammaproteobacteria bacterium]
MDNHFSSQTDRKTKDGLQGKPAVQNSLQRLEMNLSVLPKKISTLQTRYEALSKQKHTLLETGIIDATPYWHQGKYLYLIYPTKDGKRQREYVGADQRKCAPIIAALRRAQRYQQIEVRMQQLETHLREAMFLVDRLLWVMSITE